MEIRPINGLRLRAFLIKIMQNTPKIVMQSSVNPGLRSFRDFPYIITYQYRIDYRAKPEITETMGFSDTRLLVSGRVSQDELLTLWS